MNLELKMQLERTLLVWKRFWKQFGSAAFQSCLKRHKVNCMLLLKDFAGLHYKDTFIKHWNKEKP